LSLHEESSSCARFAVAVINRVRRNHFANVAKANPSIYAQMPRGYIHSPEGNKTYFSNSIPLSLTVEVRNDIYSNESSPLIYYYLDDSTFTVAAVPNGTSKDGWLVFVGQTVLTNMTDGEHSLAIAAISGSSMASMVFPSVEFSVASPPTNNTQSFPTLPIAVSVTATSIIGLALLVYIKKRRR
jgi:hypothetical protein